MTTIAWDGKSIVADKQATSGHLKVKTTKLVKLKNGWIAGFAGSLSEARVVEVWLNQGADRETKPTVENLSVMMVSPDGREVYEMEEQLELFQIEGKFHAIGSGERYAIMAMHLGKTAREAVKLTSKYDPYTGLGVTEFKLR